MHRRSNLQCNQLYKDFSINVISKSGTTMETTITYKLLKGLLEEKYRLESLIKSVERAKLTPYFARIDFEDKEKEICYIGKLGVSDYDNNIIKTSNNEIKYKYLIIATGRRNRKLNLENE